VVRGAERLRAWCEGFSLHAGVVIADHDRDALERLCRYGARPAFAQERLSWTSDGRIAYRLKRPWPDGRTELVMPPVAFLRRLCGIIPPPRRHLVTYSGVFGPAAKDRGKLRALVPACDDAVAPPCSPKAAAPHLRTGRLPWADLLRGVFADDVLQCACGGRRSIIAVVTDPTLARTLLVALDLPHEPSAFAGARPAAGRARVGRSGVVAHRARPRKAPVCPRADLTFAALHLAKRSRRRSCRSVGATVRAAPQKPAYVSPASRTVDRQPADPSSPETRLVAVRIAPARARTVSRAKLEL